MPRYLSNQQLLILVSCLILLFIGTLIALNIGQRLRLDSSSQELSINVIQTMFGEAGSADSILAHASPELQSQYQNSSLASQIEKLQRGLGDLVSIRNFSGGSQVPLWPFNPEQRLASYLFDLEFSRSTAVLNLVWLMSENDQWQLQSFQLNSPALQE